MAKVIGEHGEEFSLRWHSGRVTPLGSDLDVIAQGEDMQRISAEIIETLGHTVKAADGNDVPVSSKWDGLSDRARMELVLRATRDDVAGATDAGEAYAAWMAMAIRERFYAERATLRTEVPDWLYIEIGERPWGEKRSVLLTPVRWEPGQMIAFSFQPYDEVDRVGWGLLTLALQEPAVVDGQYTDDFISRLLVYFGFCDRW